MNEKLLLIEDDIEIARIIRDTLSKEHYQVTWATTGLEGWEDFKNATYDLVLVDLMLPEMDGFTVIKNIRLKSEVPIIILSAKKEDMDKVEGFTQGADDYMAKPFSLVELKARVASQLRRWQRYQGVKEPATIVQYEHQLTVDWQKEIVTLCDERLSLTMIEFDLFTLLAQHPARTFTKEELYEHVWQLEATKSDLHTVTVHIKSLREKLHDPVKTPHYIQTVWGKGYRFIGEIV